MHARIGSAYVSCTIVVLLNLIDIQASVRFDIFAMGRPPTPSSLQLGVSLKRACVVQIVFIIDFIEKIAGDVDGSDEEVTKAAVGLLGDVASTVHNIGVTFKTKNFYVSLITSCSQSADETLASTARWAGQAIQNSIIQAA
jgi:hypothetical protein